MSPDLPSGPLRDGTPRPGVRIVVVIVIAGAAIPGVALHPGAASPTSTSPSDAVAVLFEDRVPADLDVGRDGVVVQRVAEVPFVTIRTRAEATDAVVQTWAARDDTVAAYRPARIVLQADGLEPDDPLYGTQDSYGIVGFEEAWSISQEEIGALGSHDVSVAILDNGVDHHEDLDGNRCSTVTPATAAFRTSSSPPHGTIVAGIAVAETDNGVGVAGGANVCLMDVPIMYRGLGSFQTRSAEGIIQATRAGADVISMSYGSSAPDPIERRAIAYAWERGVTLIAAAGNAGRPCTGACYPADYDHVLDVAGLTNATEVWSGSLTGAVAAPATPETITTVDPGGGYASPVIAGTSWATPHVSALAGLMLSVDGDLGNAELRCTIEATAANLGDTRVVYGRIDAEAAVDAARDPATRQALGC